MAPDADANTAAVLIKKYSNRRLYDTTRSRYITLEELGAMIRDGATVRVVDAKAGTDLTRAVLLQAILEEQGRQEMLPVELLHHIIRVQGTVMQGPFAAFLAMAIKQFSATGQLWERQVAGMFEGMPGMPGMAGMAGLAGMAGMPGTGGAAGGTGAAAADDGGGGGGNADDSGRPAEPSPGDAERSAAVGGSDQALDNLRDRMGDLLAQLDRGKK